MKVSAKILIAVLSAALFVAACSNGPKVIPRSKMEKICTDMFMADQWQMIQGIPRFAIDTALFYEPIFRNYGYTTDDFRASIEYYMRDPLKFSRMMRKIALKMEAEADKLNRMTGIISDETAEEEAGGDSEIE